MLNAPFADLRGEHRAEPVPPQPYCLMANIDAALEQDILNLAQRQRVANVHHHREANNLGRRVEISKWIFHPETLRTDRPRIKPVCFDSATETALAHDTHDNSETELSGSAPIIFNTMNFFNLCIAKNLFFFPALNYIVYFVFQV